MLIARFVFLIKLTVFFNKKNSCCWFMFDFVCLVPGSSNTAECVVRTRFDLTPDEYWALQKSPTVCIFRNGPIIIFIISVQVFNSTTLWQ